MTLDAVTKGQMECPTWEYPKTNCLLINDMARGEPVVSIDLNTGEVTLRRPVSEASQLFWDAVSRLVLGKGDR